MVGWDQKVPSERTSSFCLGHLFPSPSLCRILSVHEILSQISMQRENQTGHQAEAGLSPQQRTWLRRLQEDIAQNPHYFSTSEDILSEPVQTETSQTQFDTLDYLRQLAQQELRPDHQAEYQFLRAQVNEQVFQDLQVFLREHYMLRHQSNVWPLDTESLLEDWIVSGEKAVDKARRKRDQATTEALWRTRHIKYERFHWETEQIRQLQTLMRQFLEDDAFTPLPAGEILGPSLSEELTSLGFTLPSLEKSELHPGRLAELGLQATDQIEVSPKFSLVMPANGFVHPGNLAYAVVYQVVRHQDQAGHQRYWLVSDHYYSQLAYEELATIINDWSPETNHPVDTAQPLQEQLLMEVVSALPASFTRTKPFSLFLQLAEKLHKNVTLPGGYSFAFEQNHVTAELQRQTQNVRQAGAVLTQVLLSELALCEIYAERHEYVGQVLQDMFDKVILALLSVTDAATGDFSPAMVSEILTLYRKIYIEDLLQLPDFFASEEASHEQDLPQQIWLQHARRNPLALQHPSSLQDLADEAVYDRQAAGRQKHGTHLDMLNNLFLLSMTTVPNATKGLFSCAACAGGMFGKLRSLGGVESAATAGKSVGWAGKSLGFFPGVGELDSQGGFPGDPLGRDTAQNINNSFLNRQFASARQAVGGFFNSLPAGELPTFFMLDQQLFDQVATR